MISDLVNYWITYPKCKLKLITDAIPITQILMKTERDAHSGLAQWYGLPPIWMQRWLLYINEVHHTPDSGMAYLQYECHNVCLDYSFWVITAHYIDMIALHCGCEYEYSEFPFQKIVYWYGFSPVWMQWWMLGHRVIIRTSAAIYISMEKDCIFCSFYVEQQSAYQCYIGVCGMLT